jgi:uncharacterized protein YjbK
MGLAISLKQAELMGGTLKVKSELRKGLKFFFTLKLPPPIENTETNDRTRFKNVKKIKPEREIKALVVDDNLENRDVLKNFLKVLESK